MLAIINSDDKSVAIVQKPGRALPQQMHDPSWLQRNRMFLVEVPDDCLDGIDPEEWSNLEYVESSNTLALEEGAFNPETERGRQFLLEELRKISLIPVEARGSDALQLVQLSRQFLPKEEIDKILADDVLSDEEITDILNFLDSDDDN